MEKITAFNYGGIKKIELTDLTNTDFSDLSKVEEIPFRRSSAKMGTTGNADEGGYYVDKVLSFIIPKKQNDREDFIARLANTTFAIRATDFNEEYTILYPAKIIHGYDSGTKRIESNGYEVNIRGTEIYAMSDPRPVEVTITPPIYDDEDLPGDEVTPFNPPPSDEVNPILDEGDDGGADGPGGTEDTDSTIPECVYISIFPQQSGNSIDANFYNLPDNYTLEISLDGTVLASALPYTITESGLYKIKVITADCEKFSMITAEYTDAIADFAVSINENNGTLSAVTDANAPSYLWDLETYNANTGSTTTETIGTADSVQLTSSGIYHLTVTDGVSNSTYFYYQSALNVNVTNLGDIANASGSVQTISGTTGFSFNLEYDDSRYIIDRNGVVLSYIENVTASNMDIGQYTVIDGNLIISSLFPLEADEIITIRPV